MAGNETALSTEWLSVVGKALCYLSLSKAMERDPEKFEDVLTRVKFLEGLGLSQSDAAGAAGSTANSVRVLRSKRGKAKNASAKKKKSRRLGR